MATSHRDIQPGNIKLKNALVEIEGIGKVRLIRRRNSARISMRLKTDGTLSINFPWYVTEHEALKFARGNIRWIEEQQQKRIERKKVYHPGETINTKFHIIEIKQSEKETGYASIKGNKVIVVLPALRPVESNESQGFINEIRAKTYRREARSYLPERTAALAQEHGLSYNKVFIKRLKSKWGSCSNKKNINLNLYLMALPDHLIDYIILHELAHTIEPNHGPGFWRLLDGLTQGKAKQFDKEIKKHHLGD